MTDENGWREHQKLVLHELKRNDSRLLSIEAQIAGLRVDLQVLRARVYAGATVLGATAGTCSSIIIALLKMT